jgi:hypothetical protein
VSMDTGLGGGRIQKGRGGIEEEPGQESRWQGDGSESTCEWAVLRVEQGYQVEQLSGGAAVTRVGCWELRG